MRRWALVVGTTIQVVVEQDSKPQVHGEWHEVFKTVGPGDVIIDGFQFRAGSAELQSYLASQPVDGGN